MRRTNIYLDDHQLDGLRRLAERRGRPVAELVREALDAWLDSQGVRAVPEDEWQRRFDDLLARRRGRARTRPVKPETVERDVLTAVREVRRARAARRR
jgi:Arc/MetJ-type ribon-helix-helix transcriptional regulator